MTAIPDTQPGTTDRVAIRADHRQVKQLGEWTTARQFTIDARSSMIVLDLLLPILPAGDIDIDLEIDHSAVKLLVPEDAHIDHTGLHRIGRGHVEDRSGSIGRSGRRISLRGEMRYSEIRVHRGGVALLSLLPRHFADVRRAHRNGRLEPLVRHDHGRDPR